MDKIKSARDFADLIKANCYRGVCSLDMGSSIFNQSTARDLIRSRDKAIVERIKPYLEHWGKCLCDDRHDSDAIHCTCGLDDVLRELGGDA